MLAKSMCCKPNLRTRCGTDRRTHTASHSTPRAIPCGPMDPRVKTTAIVSLMILDCVTQTKGFLRSLQRRRRIHKFMNF